MSDPRDPYPRDFAGKTVLDKVIAHEVEKRDLVHNKAKSKVGGKRVNVRTMAAIRDHILNEVGVLDNIINLANGNPIPGVPDPEPKQVIDANYQLLKRIMPELRAVEITGQDGGPVEIETKVARIIELVGQVTASVTDNTKPDHGEDGSALAAAREAAAQEEKNG